jgi:hypothetical protein
MAGLVPAMRALKNHCRTKKDVDARQKAGHKGVEICLLS